MHRSLIVTDKPAWPPVSGADLRSWQIATALAELGPVTVASILPLGSTAPPPLQHISVVGLTAAGAPQTDVFARKRNYIDCRIPETAVTRLLRIAQEQRPSSIIVEGINLNPLLTLLRPYSRNLVLDMHNVESDLATQLRARAPWPLRAFDRNPERIRQAEIDAASIVDRIWVCSPRDRERLCADIGHARPHVVPNGVPRHEAFADPLPPASRDRGPLVLFVGHLGYRPNVRAVERIGRGIAPLVRSQLPTSRFLVAGRHPKKAVRRMAGAGTFELIANPSDIAEHLALAHIALVPIDLGGGTRLKILEAMAAGVPVVATPFSAEGLDVADSVHVLLADSDRACADGIARLWQDVDLWTRLRSDGRRFALDRYGPDAIAAAVHSGLGVNAQV